MDEPQAVEGGLNARGQPAGQISKIQIDVQIGQDRATRSDTLDPAQGQIHVGMGRMRAPSQGIHDLDVQVLERVESLFRQIDHVTGIGHATEAIPYRSDAAMVLIEGGDPDRT